MLWPPVWPSDFLSGVFWNRSLSESWPLLWDCVPLVGNLGTWPVLAGQCTCSQSRVSQIHIYITSKDNKEKWQKKATSTEHKSEKVVFLFLQNFCSSGLRECSVSVTDWSYSLLKCVKTLWNFSWGYNYPKFSVGGMKTPFCLDCATLTILASSEPLSSKRTYLLKQHHVGFRVNIAVISNHHVDIIGNCHLKQHHAGFRSKFQSLQWILIIECHLKQERFGIRVNGLHVEHHIVSSVLGVTSA